MHRLRWVFGGKCVQKWFNVDYFEQVMYSFHFVELVLNQTKVFNEFH